MDVKRLIALGIGLASFTSLAVYNLITSDGGFINELIVFFVLYLFAFFLYDRLRLNIYTYSMLFFSFLLHGLGVFGYYGTSPLPVPWDVVTHFFPIMFTSIIFFNFLRPYMGTRFTWKSFIIISLVFLSALGVGSIVENGEFVGFIVFGFGDGGFRFGEGDTCPGQEYADTVETYIGGWFDAMWDLIVNLAGAFLGVLIMTLVTFCGNKKKRKIQTTIRTS